MEIVRIVSEYTPTTPRSQGKLVRIKVGRREKEIDKSSGGCWGCWWGAGGLVAGLPF